MTTTEFAGTWPTTVEPACGSSASALPNSAGSPRHALRAVKSEFRKPRYQITLAADAFDVLAAQRLRHDVFTGECGAITPGPPGLDIDEFDDVCDHLIVRKCDAPEGTSCNPVIATYRLLPPYANDSDPRALGLYSHREFDIRSLEGILHSTVEAGRSCVAAENRGTSPISLLWTGIARYMQLTSCRYLIGCASVSLADGGANAAAVADLLMERHLSNPEYRVSPRIRFHLEDVIRSARPVVPPLLRGYLRLGAVVCGPPAVDSAFGTADFLVLLDLEAADPRYLRHFLGSGSAALGGAG